MDACPRRYWLEQTGNGINQVSLEIMTAAGRGGGAAGSSEKETKRWGRCFSPVSSACWAGS